MEKQQFILDLIQQSEKDYSVLDAKDGIEKLREKYGFTKASTK